MLRAPGDLGPDLRALEVTAQVLDHTGQVVVAAGRAVADQAHDLVVDLGVERGEGEVLELPLQGVHSQPVGQWGIDLEGLPGRALGRGRLDVGDRAHVVQPVGELDDQDADVAGHRDDHLAHGLGLRGLAVGHPVELGHAVDEVGDLVTEVRTQRHQRVRRVLDGVVQQGRTQRRRGHAQLGQDRGHGQRMGDVGVAALTHLPAVVLLGDVVGLLQHPQVGLRVGLPHDPEERLQHRVGARPLGAQPGQPGPDPAAGGSTTRGGGGRGLRYVGLLRVERGRGRGVGHGCPPARSRCWRLQSTGGPDRVASGEQHRVKVRRTRGGQGLAPREETELEQHRDAHDLGPALTHERDGGRSGAPGGEHVVHHQHP